MLNRASKTWRIGFQSGFAPCFNSCKHDRQMLLLRLFRRCHALIQISVWIFGAVAAAAAPAELIIQRGPQLEVDAAVYSPDGRVIASSGESETIRLWDRESGDLIGTLPGHPERVFGLAISPDGRLLASSSTDGSVKLWDYRQGQLLHVFTNHLGNWVRRVAFSPDSRLLAPAAYDGTVSLWDVTSGRVVRTLAVKDPISEVLFTPDGRSLVTASRSDTRPFIQFWNVTNGEPELTINATNSLWEIALSRDGRLLASCGANGVADVWALPGGKLLREFKVKENPVFAIDLSPDGKRVVLGGHLIDTIRAVDTGALLCELRGHQDDTFQVHFSPDGREVVSASADASLRQWDAASGKVRRIIAPHPPDLPVTSIAFSPDGAWEAVGGVDGVVRVWDARNGGFKYELHGHEGPVHTLSFSLDSAWLCSGSADRTMRVWDMNGGTISTVHPYFERVDEIGTEAFGGTENLVASAGGPWASSGLDHTIKLWLTHFDRPVRILRGHTANVLSVAFARGIDLLASTSVDGTTKLWDSRRAVCLAPLTIAVPAEVLAFSPDARWLAAGLADGTVELLDTNGLAIVRAWRAHQRPVQSLQFSPDGRWLATAGADQSVALWDWTNGRERRRFSDVTSQYLPLAFQPDQPVLAFAQNDDTVVHVNLETGEVLFKREFFPDGEWLAWNPQKPFYLASARGDEHAHLRFANQLSPVYPLALYRSQLSRPTNFLAALAGPAPAIAPKNFQLWWHRYRYKDEWFYGGLSLLTLWITLRLRRGRVAERRRRAQENISRQLLISQEAERKRIAAELHDSLGQNLLIIKNRLHLARQATKDAAPAEQLEEIAQTVSATIAEVREISYNLRPYQLDRLGLTKAVQSVVRRVSDSGFLKVESHLANIDGLFPAEHEINFYRIVQECLNNIIKHSDAAWAQVSIRLENHTLTLLVEDDGKGFNFRQTMGEAQKSRGFGLTGLGERARIFGGTFTCDSAPGQGARLTFVIPVPKTNSHAG